MLIAIHGCQANYWKSKILSCLVLRVLSPYRAVREARVLHVGVLIGRVHQRLTNIEAIPKPGIYHDVVFQVSARGQHSRRLFCSLGTRSNEQAIDMKVWVLLSKS